MPRNQFIIEDDAGARDTGSPQSEWVGMPEFVQDDLTPFRAINVRFRNAEDVERFEKLIGQSITPKQKAVWFPHMENRKTAHLIYAGDDAT